MCSTSKSSHRLGTVPMYLLYASLGVSQCLQNRQPFKVCYFVITTSWIQVQWCMHCYLVQNIMPFDALCSGSQNPLVKPHHRAFFHCLVYECLYIVLLALYYYIVDKTQSNRNFDRHNDGELSRGGQRQNVCYEFYTFCVRMQGNLVGFNKKYI